MNNKFKKSLYILIAVVLGLSSIGVVAADSLSESLWVDTNMCSEVDPKTGLTCNEINDNPGQDIYYVVTSSHVNDAIWETAHQDPGTVRWDITGTKFIVKYNSDEIPRAEVGIEKALGAPMNHAEVLAYLDNPLNGFFDPEYYIDNPLIPVIPIEEVPLIPVDEIPVLPEEPVDPAEDPEVVTTPTEDPTAETSTGEVLGEVDSGIPEENPESETNPVSDSPVTTDEEVSSEEGIVDDSEPVSENPTESIPDSVPEPSI